MYNLATDMFEMSDEEEQIRRETVRLTALIRQARSNIQTEREQSKADDDANYLEFSIKGSRRVRKVVTAQFVAGFPRMYYDSRERHDRANGEPVWLTVPVKGVSSRKYRMRLIRPMWMIKYERQYAAHKTKEKEDDDDDDYLVGLVDDD